MRTPTYYCWLAAGSPAHPDCEDTPGARCWVCAGDTPRSTDRVRWLGASYTGQNRDPSWADIRAVRDLFYPPDVDVMQILPQRQDYVNLQQHCFHLWQTPVEWGIR